MPMSTLADPPTEVAEEAAPAGPVQLPRCRRLNREVPINRAGAVVGPRLLVRCTAEVVADEKPHLCATHLSEAMRFLADAGAVVILAELPDELVEQIGRWQLATQIVQEKVDDGTLVRLPSGGLIEADRAGEVSR